jgi:hypothetical protein
MEMEGALPRAGNINELYRVTSLRPKYLSGDGYENRRIVERYHGRLTLQISIPSWISVVCCLCLLGHLQRPRDQTNAVFLWSAQFLYVVLSNANELFSHSTCCSSLRPIGFFHG